MCVALDHAGLVVAVFRALGSPARLALLRRLSVAPARVGVLSEELGIAQLATSTHLGILRDANLVVARRDGRFAVYSLTDGAAVAGGRPAALERIAGYVKAVGRIQVHNCALVDGLPSPGIQRRMRERPGVPV
ncbi:metalloregulator ArsR/SmtB family transcription factor [Amycolatopsis mediterranei]|uniref:ArsR/SmtB family transcription factor n=1 Tax=Amycolatopsis mediterranei TaxID=33910 RepID=UPI00341482E9